ncbi:MAG: GatB/YqeY domain-containing protein [Tindallia sp. MSAO_Bac2]|nr:MAG: GatB/YqeY domain-containing protein [Tindallia sp. MSAO_Bac2]
MSLKDHLAEDLKTAMKNKELTRKNVITMIRSSVKQIEVDERKELSDEDVLQIIMKQVKQRNDALESFKSAGREDLVEQTKEEISILESYLPEPLTEEEILQSIQNAIDETGAESMKDMGAVMNKVMADTKGKADGKIVSQLVRQKLQ